MRDDHPTPAYSQPASPPHTVSTTLVDDLNNPLTLYAASPADLNALLRVYGRKGYRSERGVPPGGLTLPLAQHDTFDPALIGARFWTNQEGETLLLHGGHAYRQRLLKAVDSRKMKLPPAIKYSRGAKGTDPDHIREKSDGEFEYVTLICFRGNGPARPEYSLPGGACHAAARCGNFDPDVKTVPPGSQAA